MCYLNINFVMIPPVGHCKLYISICIYVSLTPATTVQSVKYFHETCNIFTHISVFQNHFEGWILSIDLLSLVWAIKHVCRSSIAFIAFIAFCQILFQNQPYSKNQDFFKSGYLNFNNLMGSPQNASWIMVLATHNFSYFRLILSFHSPLPGLQRGSKSKLTTTGSPQTANECFLLRGRRVTKGAQGLHKPSPRERRSSFSLFLQPRDPLPRWPHNAAVTVRCTTRRN